MADFEEKAVDLLEKLETLSEQYAPKALELAVEVARMEAISALLTGAVAVIAVFVLWPLAKKVYEKSNSDQDSYGGMKERYFIVLTFIAIAGGVAAVVALVQLFNAWNWVGAFNPELYLAKKIIL